MKMEMHESQLMNTEKKLRFQRIINLAFLLIIFLQSIIPIFLLNYAFGKHSTHFIPPAINQTFSISNKGFSENYLKDMTHFLMQLRFNVTPATANTQFNILLTYVSPGLYGELRRQLIQEMEQIKHEHLSTAFYPLSLELDLKGFSAKVRGQMKRFVGADPMTETTETFLIQYRYENGLLTIKNIEKVKT